MWEITKNHQITAVGVTSIGVTAVQNSAVQYFIHEMYFNITAGSTMGADMTGKNGQPHCSELYCGHISDKYVIPSLH